MTETFYFFWGGPASQWYESDFEIDGTTYNCAEQYMMAQKAELFADQKSLKQIMKSDDPRTQKKLGRAVTGFDQTVWERECKQIVYRANLAKFTQNPQLTLWLLSQVETTFVEASPYDKVWGIGLGEQDPLRLDRLTWQGTNWLGEAITNVRNDIRKLIEIFNQNK